MNTHGWVEAVATKPALAFQIKGGFMPTAQEHIDEGFYPSSVKDALERWDNGKILWSVEMGGLGPGYEQCIQVAVFEILRGLQGQKIPSDHKERQDFYDKILHEAMAKPENKILNGLSGSQAGAAMNLASKLFTRGWVVLDEVPDRHIQVTKTFT